MTGVFNSLTGYHNRRSIRLKGYDYTRPGAYFITMCVHPHTQLVFGEIPVGATGASPKTGDHTGIPRMELNAFGTIVREEWERSFEIRRELQIDEYQIMPDHFHAIVIIRDQKQYVQEKEIEDRTVSGEIDKGDTPVARTDFVQKKITESNPITEVPYNCLDAWTETENPIITGETFWSQNQPKGARPRSIGALIAGFKASTIRRINAARNMSGKRVWQRDYYDRIVRDNRALYFIRQYIRNNPLNWIIDGKNHMSKERVLYSSETLAPLPVV
jgi:putative transposase